MKVSKTILRIQVRLRMAYHSVDSCHPRAKSNSDILSILQPLWSLIINNSMDNEYLKAIRVGTSGYLQKK